MEGVMMRGSNAMAVAVRQPDGEIIVHTEPLSAHIYAGRISKIPVLRALTSLWDVLVLGIRTLMFSADVALAEEEDVDFSGPVAWGTIAVSFIVAIGLFFVGPLLLVGVIDRYIESALLSNVIEGIIRLTIFVAYIWAIGRLPDIARVFAYHGAAQDDQCVRVRRRADAQGSLSVLHCSLPLWHGLSAIGHGDLDSDLCTIGSTTDGPAHTVQNRAHPAGSGGGLRVHPLHQPA